MRFEQQIVPQVDRLSAAFEHSITWEDDLWRADPVDVEAIHAAAQQRRDAGAVTPADASTALSMGTAAESDQEAAAKSGLPELPGLTNVTAQALGDSVSILFDPVPGAVDYRVYEGATHTTVIVAAQDDVVQWLADRVAGKPAPTTCA